VNIYIVWLNLNAKPELRDSANSVSRLQGKWWSC